ncbi:MAG: endonuclease V [Phycisphaerae bacterium]|nr:MAG: endonuclease V [Phycisphaerae bacterium]
MKFKPTPHRWSLTPKQAIRIQSKLAGKVIVRKPTRQLRYIVGVDLAFTSGLSHCIAAAVVWDRRDKHIVESAYAKRPVRLPYIPGLLSFREAPAVLAALRKVRHPVDAIMCDGHGLAHPRRFGIACHVGYICNVSALGCGKSRLIGEHDDPAVRRGSSRPLKVGTEKVGLVLRTRDYVKPVYISVGHLIDLDTARRVALDCACGYRLPEPTRQADILVAKLTRSDRGVTN